jgi:hypothetical protein
LYDSRLKNTQQKGLFVMKRFMLLLIVAVAAFVLLLPGCKKNESSQSSNVALTKEAPENTAAGVLWSYPSRWTRGAPRQMRVVTYVIPAAEGDAEPGECAVSYFGSGAGGDAEMNIMRWSSQFEGSPSPVRKDDKISGMNVVKVQISGSYLAPAGPMMAATGKKDNFRLHGVIVEAPEGKLFFKFTGPAKTVEGAGAELDALIGSLTKK